MDEAAKNITERHDALRLRSAAYGEHTAARDAVEQAQRQVKAATRDVHYDLGTDIACSATMRGRLAIAKIKLEEASQRLAEAKRDLAHARQLSAKHSEKEFELGHLD